MREAAQFKVMFALQSQFAFGRNERGGRIFHDDTAMTQTQGGVVSHSGHKLSLFIF